MRYLLSLLRSYSLLLLTGTGGLRHGCDGLQLLWSVVSVRQEILVFSHHSHLTVTPTTRHQQRNHWRRQLYGALGHVVPSTSDCLVFFRSLQSRTNSWHSTPCGSLSSKKITLLVSCPPRTKSWRRHWAQLHARVRSATEHTHSLRGELHLFALITDTLHQTISFFHHKCAQ